MLIVLILMTGKVCLLRAGFLIASQRKRSHIRHAGTRVMAKMHPIDGIAPGKGLRKR
jgi:hypothetical protein